jgi:apolipoprotein N-acyltransferase
MNILLPFLSGIFLGIGFIIPQLSFFCWFSLIPLLFFLNKKNFSPKKVFLTGLFSGFIYLGMVFSWYFETLPLDWLGINNDFLGIFLVFLIWFSNTIFLALFISLFSLSFYLLKRGWCFNLFLFPSLWIIFEYFRAWGFSILWWGKESLLGPHWTFGNLSYTISQNSNLKLLAIPQLLNFKTQELFSALKGKRKFN